MHLPLLDGDSLCALPGSLTVKTYNYGLEIELPPWFVRGFV